MKNEKNSIMHKLLGSYSNYLTSILPLTLICYFLFFFSLYLGYLFGNHLPAEYLRDLIVSNLPNSGSMTSLQWFLFFVINNAGKSLIFLFLGILGGVIPIIFIVFNGFITGWTVYLTLEKYDLLVAFVGLAPHGIFEVSAVMITMAMGMNLGYRFINSIQGRGKILPEIWIALRFFITRLLPMFILAALIEAYVTPVLLILARG